MGGKIEAESQLNNGSTFTIRIPIRLASASREKTARHSPGAPTISSGGRQSSGLTVLRHALKSRAVKVDTATDGGEAIRAAALPSLRSPILMDLQMPDMDGLEATACRAPASRLSERAHPRPDRQLLCSEIRQKQCQQHGMQDFLSKPITPPALWSAVSRWLNLPE